ncbi:hypothetical protein F5883DRAFT_722746 [Diaporthe sp. PMI_573]|nr:hypothetical protein F5883DRAFT_722746 [Diaporthaceae sp. PMI_573]
MQKTSDMWYHAMPMTASRIDSGSAVAALQDNQHNTNWSPVTFERASLPAIALTSYGLTDFVDAGEFKENADFKLREMLRLYAENAQCKHIYLAACHDAGYVSQLTAYRGHSDRFTLIRTSGLHFHDEFTKLGLGIEELPGVFRATGSAMDVLYPKPILGKPNTAPLPSRSRPTESRDICAFHSVAPYYERDKGNDFSNSTTLFDYIYRTSLNASQGKPVWVTETGYPASGPTFGQAVASVSNAGQYWQDIGCERLFGRVNTWWYTLRDSNPANKEKFAITDNLSTTAKFNLTCAPGSGAPAAINLESKAPSAYSNHPLFIASALGLSLWVIW